jgi:hypothetical protein
VLGGQRVLAATFRAQSGIFIPIDERIAAFFATPQPVSPRLSGHTLLDVNQTSQTRSAAPPETSIGKIEAWPHCIVPTLTVATFCFRSNRANVARFAALPELPRLALE